MALLVVTAEVGLQLLVRDARQSFGRGSPVDARGDELRILCIGDSHTYGAGVEPDEAYPRQLEARLEPRFAPRPVQVINAGFPGVNSAFVAHRLGERIDQFDPTLVIVWVGANNRWNSLETGDDGGDGAAGGGGSGSALDGPGPAARVHRALLHSKLYRYAAVLATNARDGSDESAEMPWQRRDEVISDSELVRGVGRDVRAMTEIARSRGVPIVFVTYPLHLMAATNAAIHRTASELGVPVVLTSTDFQRARRDGYERRDLIVNASGPHPTGLLYGYVAESLEALVVALLQPGPAPASGSTSDDG